MTYFARGNLTAGWRKRLLAQPLDPRTRVQMDKDAHAERVAASQRVAAAYEEYKSQDKEQSVE